MARVEETAQRLCDFFEAVLRKSKDPDFKAPTEPYSPREHLKAPIRRVYEQCVGDLAPGECAELDRIICKMWAIRLR